MATRGRALGGYRLVGSSPYDDRLRNWPEASRPKCGILRATTNNARTEATLPVAENAEERWLCVSQFIICRSTMMSQPQGHNVHGFSNTLRTDSPSDKLRQHCTLTQRTFMTIAHLLTLSRNINFFALTFVITVSCFVVVLDITLLKFLVFLSEFRRLTGLSHRLSRWTQDGVLQLQRRAYEAQGRGTWVNLDDDVPLTVSKERLEDLPLTRVLVDFTDSKASSGHRKEDEDFTPRPLRSTKTWATQETAVSTGEFSLKKSHWKGSKLEEDEKH
jgi:hypothetical protein